MPFPQRSAGDAAVVKGKPASQNLLNSLNALIGSLDSCSEVNIGRNRRLIRAIDAGKIFQLSAPCFGV
jgi:hypothetical protein